MLIGVDLDDVLADFIPALAEYHNATYGTNLTKRDVHSFALEEVWGGTRAEAIEKTDNFKKSRLYKNMFPVEGSIEAVKLLKQYHQLLIVTSRSVNHLSEIEKWIKKYYNNCFSGIYFAYNIWTKRNKKTKAELCLDLGAEYMIDDSVEYLLQCLEKGIKPILVDNP